MARVPGEIRLAWIIGRLNVGGPAVHVLAAATALRSRGFRSVVLAGPPGPREGDLGGEARARGIEVVPIPEMHRAVRPLDDARALWRITGELHRLRPHVVQTQTAKAGALGRVAARLARVPVVVHAFHGHVFEGYFGPLASRGIVLAERLLARVGDAVAAVSPAQAEELARRWRISRAPIPVLPLAVEIEPLLGADARRGEIRRELGIAPDALVVAYVGRIIDIKEIPLLLGAAEEVRASGIPLVLLLVGDGDRRPDVENEVRASGRGDWVRFTGWRRDLDRVYADADVVALASRSEGAPVCLVEAMAAGKAIVATRVGGVPDLLRDGETGSLVPPGDRRALAVALAALLADPARRSAMGAAARADARGRFGAERAAAELEAFYRGLLDGRER
jgi:glycosyltransferase involved in cell wall biosynthesis